MYRVRVTLRGSDFATSVQDQVVETWSDDRLKKGGIGFFSSKGEQSLLRWVTVSHQYDALGRLERASYLVVVFGPDHFNGFFYELMPAFCIGTAAEGTAAAPAATPAAETGSTDHRGRRSAPTSPARSFIW